MSAPEVFESTCDHLLATYQGLGIIIWRRETTLAAIASSDRMLAELARAHERIGLLTVVEADAPVPSSEARKALVSLLAKAKAIHASAVAYEGEGFRAAAVRGVVTGLTMLAHQTFPHKVFATVPGAAEWLAPQLADAGHRLTASAVVDAVEELRRR